MLNLDQMRGALVVQAEGDAVAQFAARVQPRVEQVTRHHVTERLHHRLLYARMSDLEIHAAALSVTRRCRISITVRLWSRPRRAVISPELICEPGLAVVQRWCQANW